MNIKDLMEMLSHIDPNSEVRAVDKYGDSDEGGSFPITAVEHGIEPDGRFVCRLTNEQD